MFLAILQLFSFPQYPTLRSSPFDLRQTHRCEWCFPWRCSADSNLRHSFTTLTKENRNINNHMHDKENNEMDSRSFRGLKKNKKTINTTEILNIYISKWIQILFKKKSYLSICAEKSGAGCWLVKRKWITQSISWAWGEGQRTSLGKVDAVSDVIGSLLLLTPARTNEAATHYTQVTINSYY